MVLSVVIIGAAGHYHLVTDELARRPEARLAACAPSFAREDVTCFSLLDAGAPPPAYYADWRAMLDAERPDIVVVCGRYDLNAPLALEAIRRGCHVICEKPAGQTLAEVAALRRALERAGVVYALMLPLRYEPAFYTAHLLVSQGVIGEPLLISAQKSYRWGARPAWYADRALYGSTMTWVGIHALDYARWAAGVDYVELSARHANLAHPERPGCQDVAAVLARLANGGAAAFTFDYLRPAAAPTHGDDRLRVAGSRGVIEVCDQGARLSVVAAAGDVPAWPLESPGRPLFGDFLAAVAGRGELLAPAEEALGITAWAILAARSADSGGIVVKGA